ncbi:hypothetical protein DFH29DRAFT_982795 [Suillus ampliporus]|nr:hypothetical protein DFH29DRAFT_982795 [Suillus ampliporus]
MENAMASMPTESASSIVQAVDPSEPPPKRKPGRPKGSGKKQPPDPAIISEKIKRPVGRPRKDGLPAGSVGARKANQQRRSSAKLSADAPQLPPGVPFPGAYYPQHPGIPPPWQGFAPQAPQISPPVANANAVTNTQQPSIDPNLNRDEWAELAHTKPNVLMQALLGAIAAPNPIASGGPTVEEAFKSHLASLMPSQNQNKDAHPIPSLYSVLRTLWLPSSPSYLSLIAPRTTARGTHSEHRFLYWDPLPLVLAGIHCTACGSTLLNRGRIRSGPVKVYDLDKPFFIIGCDTSPEGRKFASTDASVMQGLPVRLREEFPARLLQGDADLGPGTNVWNWHAVGVSKTLWNMVKACLKVGIPKDNIISIIDSVQNPPADEKRDQDQEYDADYGGAGGDIFRRVLENNNQVYFSDAWKGDSSAAEPGPSTQSHSAAPRASSTLGSVTPDHPAAASTSTSVQPQPQPQAQAPPQVQQFAFGQPGPYVSYAYPGYSYYPQHPQNQSAPPPSTSQPHTPNEPNGLKRAYGYGENTSEVAILEPSQKRTRHCCKCGSQDCKGKGGRTFCLNACQDCGKIDCKGRNSRRPDKVCSEAWN